MHTFEAKRLIERCSSHFLTGTFISRLTGMVRDLSMAFFFGTMPQVAAFLVAFRLSNLLRRLLGEGALLNGFIPFFESKRKEDPLKGALFFRDLFWSLTFLLLGIVVSLEGVGWGLYKAQVLSEPTWESVLTFPNKVWIIRPWPYFV